MQAGWCAGFVDLCWLLEAMYAISTANMQAKVGDHSNGKALSPHYTTQALPALTTYIRCTHVQAHI